MRRARRGGRRRGDARPRARRRALREIRERQRRRHLRRGRAISRPPCAHRPAGAGGQSPPLVHIFLVGPPGIGKSSVAPILAHHFGAAVIELDREIQRRAGKPNKDLIEQDGMDRFRDVESSVLIRLARTPSWVVVDTGGGAPIREDNRALMRSLGLIVGLRGSLDRVASGIAATQAKRPYQNVAPRDRARRVLQERKSAYADTDVTFDVDGATVDETARAIAAWLVSARGVRIDVADSERASPCRVLIRAGLLDHVGPHLADLGWRGRVAVVSDAATASRYEAAVLRSLDAVGLGSVGIRVPGGERGKRLSVAARLWDELAREGIGRDGGILALGGGSVGDVAGFVAATYLRGIRVAQVPTTLLGMADASIGGKTAIDIAAGKNLVGAFHSPDAVFADVTVLATLPARQLSSGLAEVTKCAFLADRESVEQLDRSLENVRAGDLGAILAAVTIAAEVKGGIVSQDPRESGLRELLNFGHTMGHAYEAASGYRVTHGEAVAIGMVYATALAERLELTAPTLRPELENLLDRAALPKRARLPKAVWSYVLRDKKARAGKLRWILPRRIGRFSEVTDVGESALRAAARVVERAA
ncbi:MAG: 3-dehydroquinate synthase [Chloroflexi bacterium]|nr:MAG: 3-dehydroquinate synthase [Chloroflexota bacterium]